MNEDLWGNLDVNISMQVPLTILKEQAAFLANRTSGLLEGNIEVETADDGQMQLDFWLIAPALSYYKTLLLRVKHPAAIYPLAIARAGEWNWKQSNTEQEFTSNLEKILQSPETQKIVRALVAQSKAT
jgi:hypothetical protein